MPQTNKMTQLYSMIGAISLTGTDSEVVEALLLKCIKLKKELSSYKNEKIGYQYE